MNNGQFRTCVICRTKKLKNELFRFVIIAKEIFFDKNQNKLGRGFYICSKKCWDDGQKKKRKIKISSRESKFIELPEKMFEDIVGD